MPVAKERFEKVVAFGELSAGFNEVYTFIARNLAVSYVDRYGDKSPKEALGMFR